MTRTRNTERMQYLRTDAIQVKPVDMDWTYNESDPWEAWEANTCDTCGKVAVSNPGADEHFYLDETTHCKGTINFDGPMMNYYYPMPGSSDRDPADIARAILKLPLCVVRLADSEDFALALTGGGMDLSWEICEAFMLLGYWPPLHFADLPDMADRGTSRRDRLIIAACKESAKIAASWAKRTRERLVERFPAKKRKAS